MVVHNVVLFGFEYSTEYSFELVLVVNTASFRDDIS